jgi:hypothetical protein
MKSKLSVCIALVFCGLYNHFNFAYADGNVTNANSGQAPGQIYRNEDYGFQLAVPQGWTATKTNFEVFHYNEVFLTINNHRPDLTLQERWTGKSTIEYNDKTILQQMQPDEAYISIGYFEGPWNPGMKAGDVADDLIPLLRTKQLAASSEKGLAELNLNFFKRGRDWHISAYLREPFTAATSNQVMSLLNSFQFVRAPVSNAGWAESLAWEQLPENIRNFAHWPVSENVGWRPEYGRNTVLVQKTDAGYTVQFALTGLGSWEYAVSADGEVKSGPADVEVRSPPPTQIPSDLPGQSQGKINAYWADPYVEATEALGKTTTTRFDSGDQGQTATVNNSKPGYEEFNPKTGWIGLHIQINGKLVNTLGPYLPCYPSPEPALNDDGSAALLVWSDESKTNARVMVFNTNGAVRFQTDCGPAVWSPIVALDGAGVLVRPNGGPNPNTFMWFTEKGRVRSMDISPNPEFVGWIPGTYKSFFSTSLGFEASYRLIDWSTGEKVWDIPGFGGDQLAITLTPTLILFSVAEPYPAGEWHKVNESLLQSGKEWVRTFYAVNVADGETVACWRGQFPHRWFDSDHDHFSRMGDKLYYVTADEFTEINIGDIMAKKNGWQ